MWWAILIVLAVLVFLNLILLLTILLIGGLIMDAVKKATQAVADAITALQTRLANGVVVQQADLDSVAASLTSAADAISKIAQ